MQDDNLLDLVNSAISTLLEVKQRLENGEGIPTELKDPEKGWEPVEFVWILKNDFGMTLDGFADFMSKYVE